VLLCRIIEDAACNIQKGALRSISYIAAHMCIAKPDDPSNRPTAARKPTAWFPERGDLFPGVSKGSVIFLLLLDFLIMDWQAASRRPRHAIENSLSQTTV
jgi:hypothetical protein